MTHPMAEEGSPFVPVVLVATDFSDAAAVAVSRAAELARRLDVRLRLLHTVAPTTYTTGYLPSSTELGESLQRAAFDRLEQEAERVARDGLEVEVSLASDLPSHGIVEAAREPEVELVVVGTSGATSSVRIHLGSTAKRVVQHSPKPVLTVPAVASPGWSLETVLLPTDFSEDATHALTEASELLGRLTPRPPRVVLFHAYHLPVEYTAYGPVPTSVHYLEDVGAEAQEQLDLMAGELRGTGSRVETSLAEGNPADAILDAAEQTRADLVVMGTHGRTGLAHLLLGSTAEQVIAHAPCPVLTVRRTERDEEEEEGGDDE